MRLFFIITVIHFISILLLYTEFYTVSELAVDVIETKQKKSSMDKMRFY